jgi:hypothetical protein
VLHSKTLARIASEQAAVLLRFSRAVAQENIVRALGSPDKVRVFEQASENCVSRCARRSGAANESHALRHWGAHASCTLMKGQRARKALEHASVGHGQQDGE